MPSRAKVIYPEEQNNGHILTRLVQTVESAKGLSGKFP